MARHYTIEEAQTQLRIVRPVLKDAVRLKREYDRAAERLVVRDEAEAAVTSHAALEDLRSQIGERLRFITALGIQVKDLDVGLIDFPSVMEGRDVLLCYRLDESEVAFWHTYEDGYRGRRRL